MKREVQEALERAGQFRRGVLLDLSSADRLRLLEDLFVDFFVEQWRVLLKWAALTGQSAQVDTGYIAQHVASIVLAEPGQGFKGKGVDLLDGTEVKSAAILSGVDRPRWNHNMGKISDDKTRLAKGQNPVWQQYLDLPNAFYLLFDRVVSDSSELVLRVRAWCIDAQQDLGWRDLLTRFVSGRSASQYNLQLHPPVGYDDDLVVNTLGNLDFVNVKVLEARIFGLADPSQFRIDWVQEPVDKVRPMMGRTVARPYVRNPNRVSRLSSAADVAPNFEMLAELLPNADEQRLAELARVSRIESHLADSGEEEGVV